MLTQGGHIWEEEEEEETVTMNGLGRNRAGLDVNW